MSQAVVALSGGQDSTTCLFAALDRYSSVEAVQIYYGQRHADAEMKAGMRVAERAGVQLSCLTIDTFRQLGQAALTNPEIPVEEEATGRGGNTYAAERGLPSTFVPGRNIILLGLAAAFALPRGAEILVTGICAQDRSGYPDCREEFAASMAETLRIGMDAPDFALWAPLLDNTKAETFRWADELGCLDVVVEESHTCYEGDHQTFHDWGYGCGECPACETRAAGWRDFTAAPA